MKVLIRNTALDGRPLEEDGEVFTGATVTDVLYAMKGATLVSDQRDIEDYIDMVLRNAKMLAGVELAVRGDTAPIARRGNVNQHCSHLFGGSRIFDNTLKLKAYC